MILDETLDRIKAEVFAATAGQHRPTDPAGGPPQDTGPADSAAGGGTDAGSQDAGTGPGRGQRPGPGRRPGAGREQHRRELTRGQAHEVSAGLQHPREPATTGIMRSAPVERTGASDARSAMKVSADGS